MEITSIKIILIIGGGSSCSESTNLCNLDSINGGSGGKDGENGGKAGSGGEGAFSDHVYGFYNRWNEMHASGTYGNLGGRGSSVCPEGYIVNEKFSKCYKYYGQSSTWYDAQNVCKVNGGQLVTIESVEENNYIFSLAVPYLEFGSEIWIGITDEGHEGTWRWSTKYEEIDATFTYWNSGEPNNGYGAGENCAYLGLYWNGRWNDDWGIREKPFLCEVYAGAVGNLGKGGRGGHFGGGGGDGFFGGAGGFYSGGGNK